MSFFRTLEELSLNAWPATKITHYDGWVLRFSNGFTRRANSVNVLCPSRLAIPTKVDWCEDQYTFAELPTVFKIFPDELTQDLTEELDQRGYETEGEAHVMTLDLPDSYPSNLEITISPFLSEQWYSDAVGFNRVVPEHQVELRNIVERIQPICGFSTLYHGKDTVAVGLAVVERDWVGLFDIVVSPEHRRKGFGRQIVQGMMHWGKENGANHCYLQAFHENSAAIALYQSLGFESQYRYHYRSKPLHKRN